jgi:uncharacterized protein YbbC (DUF1343 family)
MFRYGLENLLKNQKLIRHLRARRVGLVAHPASVDQKLNHAADLLHEALGGARGKGLACAFGPQHGLRGEKQDNMIESPDEVDSRLGIPIFSLYGEVRRPTAQMLDQFDVLLFDLQDLGCRIYTFLTTLFYVLEDAARTGKEVWVLDRPNPVGRPVEGSILSDDFHSFVGAAPMPMRHGLTLAEAAEWFIKYRKLDIEYQTIAMTGYSPEKGPGFGWLPKLPWVNPSPNAPNLNMARVYPGSVMVEGTNLSEGRGTTRPLEVIGLPEISPEEWIKRTLKILERSSPKGHARLGCRLRPCYFEPTFHKFKGELCGGVQVHVEDTFYNHKLFKPYRLFAALFKAVRELRPDVDLWRKPPYEYEFEKTPIDLISGDTRLRDWVDDPSARLPDLDAFLSPSERAWTKERRGVLRY